MVNIEKALQHAANFLCREAVSVTYDCINKLYKLPSSKHSYKKRIHIHREVSVENIDFECDMTIEVSGTMERDKHNTWVNEPLMSVYMSIYCPQGRGIGSEDFEFKEHIANSGEHEDYYMYHHYRALMGVLVLLYKDTKVGKPLH